MADNKISWWKKYRKDAFLGLAIITVVVIAVMGWHWTDTAKTKFWQNAWVILAITCLVFWIAAWAYFWNKDKGK